MPECFTWSQTSDKSITGLCSMELLRETSANMRNGCPICAVPGPYGSACDACAILHQIHMYDVDVTFEDFNGAGFEIVGPNAGVDGCSFYNRTFRVYRVSNCQWESRELELRCYSVGYSSVGISDDQRVICDTYPNGGGGPFRPNWAYEARPLVVVTAESNPSQTITFTVRVNWQSLERAVVSAFFAEYQQHITAKGTSPTCIDEAHCTYLSRFNSPSTWTTPCSIPWPFVHHPTMSAIVRPVLP